MLGPVDNEQVGALHLVQTQDQQRDCSTGPFHRPHQCDVVAVKIHGQCDVTDVKNVVMLTYKLLVFACPFSMVLPLVDFIILLQRNKQVLSRVTHFHGQPLE